MDMSAYDAKRLAEALDAVGQAYRLLRHHRPSDDGSAGFYRSAQAYRPSLLQPPHSQPRENLANWRRAFEELFAVLGTLPAPANHAFTRLIDGQRETWRILSRPKNGGR